MADQETGAIDRTFLCRALGMAAALANPAPDDLAERAESYATIIMVFAWAPQELRPQEWAGPELRASQAVRQADVEITPEMIETGLRVLHESGLVDYETPSHAPVVEDVLRAALRVKASARRP